MSHYRLLKSTHGIRVLFTISVLLLVSASQAQNVLTRATNLMQDGDSVTIEHVGYVYAGDDGTDAVWDFSGLDTEENHAVKYEVRDSSVIAYDQQIHRYQLRGDTLVLNQQDDPLLTMTYQQPMLVQHYPLQYSDTLQLTFKGEGKYCGTHFQRMFGSVKIEADAQGTIILAENDTLPNTLRIHTIETSAIRLNTDSCRNDSDNLKQTITEHYTWYARGYRYPVFTTVSSTTYDNLDLVATRQYAYRCPPQVQIEINDSINEVIREQDRSERQNSNGNHFSENNSSKKSGGSDVSYQVEVNGNQITLTFDVKQRSDVHILVADVSGVLHREQRATLDAGSGQVVSVDCTGVRHGQYALYLNVNGNIFSEKVALR